MKNKMIVISLDAMGARDLEYMSTKPNFGKLMEESSICKKVKTVYPSLTYPAHTSIVTGKLPKNHGVINNTLLQPDRPNPDWMWQRKFVKGKTLYDEAMKKGMTVASIFWPVTAKSKITYCMPEVLANRPWENQIIVSMLNGSALYEMKLFQKFGHMIRGIHQPELDNFSHASLLYTLKKYNPDLTLVHFTDLDTTRHENGLDNTDTFAAMDRHDRRLGEIIETLKDMGVYHDTTIVVLGDHCQMDTGQVVYLNYLFREKGYLKTKGDKITHYRVIAKNCDGSCYIYIKDKTLLQEVFCQLSEWKESNQYGIERIYTKEEAAQMGADDQCDFMIEAKPGYYYLDEFHTVREPVENAPAHRMYATHGYHPDKDDYHTFFMITGPEIKKGIHISEMTLMDEGATLSAILGVELDATDGRCLHELLH